MKKLMFLILAVAIAGSAWARNGSKVYSTSRTGITATTVTDATRISDTASVTAEESVDLLIWSQGTSYWKLHDASWDGVVDGNGATLSAANGAVLIENVNWNWIIECDASDCEVLIMTGGDR